MFSLTLFFHSLGMECKIPYHSRKSTADKLNFRGSFSQELNLPSSSIKSTTIRIPLDSNHLLEMVVPSDLTK